MLIFASYLPPVEGAITPLQRVRKALEAELFIGSEHHCEQEMAN